MRFEGLAMVFDDVSIPLYHVPRPSRELKVRPALQEWQVLDAIEKKQIVAGTGEISDMDSRTTMTSLNSSLR
jgi:hypothetical protein